MSIDEAKAEIETLVLGKGAVDRVEIFRGSLILIHSKTDLLKSFTLEDAVGYIETSRAIERAYTQGV